jgi:hypothetical protein
MTLRQAVQRTSRSITTLRRYIRSGRLQAEKKPGRFGPEYFVSEQALAEAGLAAAPLETPAALARRAPQNLDRTGVDGCTAEQLFRDSVPISLYQELQMKHEQLLVQYGMVRAGGARVLELQAELVARQRQLEQARSRAERLRIEMTQDRTQLRKLLRQAELEQEGRGLEIAALREKVRGLEMLTRNARTSDSIEQQFREVMDQTLRVERIAGRGPAEAPPVPPWPGKPADTDH